eukprot:m.52555 g.52555  ORF g.52555 m.52555 type:complete len:232 (+) comp11001_c2_seq1:180-875(+)
MGGVFSNGFTSFWRNSNVKIVMTGLDAAGKTTVLYKMKLGEVVTTIPTIGFNVESVKANGTEFVMWDVGGRSGIRGLEKYYMADMDAQVFVVDCNDKDRLDEVKDLLERTISMVGEIEKEKPLCPIAILANKQDLPQSIGPEELAERLNLPSMMGKHRMWSVFPCVGTSGEGLKMMLNWISSTVAQQKTQKLFYKNVVEKVASVPTSKEPIFSSPTIKHTDTDTDRNKAVL